MINRYPGRCSDCTGQVRVGEGQINLVNGRWTLTHVGICPSPPKSYHTSGDFALSINIGGHEFKPDANTPTTKNACCARCGRRDGIAWISGAGEYLCYQHQDDY